MKMPIVPIRNSTAISDAGFKKGVLLIRFTNGRHVAYRDVPVQVWQQLMAAGSAGKYYRENIKGKFNNATDKRSERRAA